jgi:uncharacterized membrane protein YhaH (DUF805 family)
MAKAYGLPSFTFPVIAWGPEPATGDPGDDGTRSFVEPREVVTTWFPDRDLRRGWTFVDREGRSWEAVSSTVTGRADWWSRFIPRWLLTPAYRLALEFEERPPVSFDAVKTRLHLAVTANPQIPGYARDRRAELRAAKDLGDLIKSEEAWAIERLQPSAWWWQWVVGEGRCSRRWFLLAGAAIVLTGSWLLGASSLVPFPIWLGSVMALAAFSLSTLARRLHDLRRTGWWVFVWIPISIVCAFVYERTQSDVVAEAAARIWQGLTLSALVLLAVLPGTRGANRYGYGRRGAP